MPDFIGGAGNDALTGTVGDDSLHGLGGDDTLDGGFGVVHAYGGDGDDLIYLDDGPGGRWYVDYDRFFADTPAQAPAPDPSVFDGGAGNDTLMTGRVETGDVLDLAAGALIHLVTLEDGSVATVREFTFSSIENVIVYGGEVIGDAGQTR